MGVVDVYRPETAAGGFTRDDEGIELYSRINALITPQSTVIDIGAGRGERFHNETSQFILELCRLQGKVKKIIGIDVDDNILEHPCLDERYIVPFGAQLPVENETANLIVAEWVLEHVEDATRFVSEIDRVLKPGGWFCAITPNANGYVGIANRILSPSVKEKLITHVWPERDDADIFPVHYRLNTNRTLLKAFPKTSWHHHSYTSNPAPKYHGNRSWAFRAIGLYQHMMPPSLETNLLVFIRKAEVGEILPR